MTEKPVDKRKAILDTALTLFTERGFHGTPTSLISQEAGVATGTLFHYFKTKEELIESLYLDIKKESRAVLSEAAGSKGDCKGKLDNISMAFAEWGLENPRKIHFMQLFCYSPFISTAAQQEGVSNFMFLIDQTKIGINEGWIRDYPPELVLSIVSSGLMAAILAAARESDPQKQRDVLKQSIDLILHGILKEESANCRKPSGV
ncbi:MAG: TetR/AcrR family transcriptional regulator [Methanolobus sp.]|nr:TetR/AcrR family transcriptional regulator [Methanolobus sp.]